MQSDATPKLRSRVFRGTLFHQRRQPVRHQFRYRAFGLAVDPLELPRLAQCSWALGYQQARPVTIRDVDYLQPGTDPLPLKVEACLQLAGLDTPPASVTMITAPRLFGFAFNPATFYFLRDGLGLLSGVLTEVNNTYGERHLYLFRDGVRTDAGVRFRQPKRFFVSPFNNLQGDYELTVRDEPERFQIGLDLHRDGEPVMRTGLQGNLEPFTTGNLLAAIAHAPGYAALALPRIFWQGLRLKRKGMRDLMKPRPPEHLTVRQPAPKASQRHSTRTPTQTYGVEPPPSHG